VKTRMAGTDGDSNRTSVVYNISVVQLRYLARKTETSRMKLITWRLVGRWQRFGETSCLHLQP
jgi:hypothetical protein